VYRHSWLSAILSVCTIIATLIAIILVGWTRLRPGNS